ncbi:MAG: spore cortex biosynthesis protein YabQ [Clostridiales bacterium]|nr:spore cortex biosynthesis protein YabQ [Clostridiales bacterium]
MSSVIRQETAVFLIFIFHGALLTLLYDVLRALRRICRHNLLVLSFEDFLYWLLAGFLTFWLSFRETSGVLRGYAAAGIFLGFLLYHLTVSRFVVRFLSALFRLPAAAFAFLWRMLSNPVKIFCKKCKKRIEFTRKRGYNKQHTRADAGKRKSHSRRGRAASPGEAHSLSGEGDAGKQKCKGKRARGTNGNKKQGSKDKITKGSLGWRQKKESS